MQKSNQSNFKEAYDKLIFVQVVESFERPGKPLAHTQKVLIEMFTPSKKYLFRDTGILNNLF